MQREVAEKIKKITNSESEITFQPLPLDDPKRRYPDITKISTTLGWKPETDLEDGLKKTVEWTRTNLAVIEKTMKKHKQFYDYEKE